MNAYTNRPQASAESWICCQIFVRRKSAEKIFGCPNDIPENQHFIQTTHLPHVGVASDIQKVRQLIEVDIVNFIDIV